MKAELDRIATALESIAGYLEQMARPLYIVEPPATQEPADIVYRVVPSTRPLFVPCPACAGTGPKDEHDATCLRTLPSRLGFGPSPTPDSRNHR